MVTVICVYGLPGSGKSTFIDVAESNGIAAISMGDIVRQKARDELSEPITGQDIGEWATEQRESRGQAVMAEHTVSHIRDSDVLAETKHDTVVIEGIRSDEEIAVFDDALNTVVPVFVKAPFDERLKRLQERGSDSREALSENGVTRSELKKRDDRERDWGLQELINAKSGEYTVQNTGTLDEYKNEVEFIISSIINN